VVVLQEAERTSEKRVERGAMAEAWSGLLQQRADWPERYRRQLLAAFHVAASASGTVLPSTASRPVPLATDSLHFSKLSLVDDAQVTQDIEFSRLLQQLQMQTDRPLTELNALMSSLQGLPNVRPDLNPLRPEVFARTLLGVVLDTPAEPAIQTLWLKHLTSSFGQELGALYQRLVQQLEGAHVQAVTYRVAAHPGSTGHGPLSGHEAHDPAGARPSPPAFPGASRAEGAGRSGRHVMAPASHVLAAPGENLWQDFLVHGSPAADRPLPPSYYADIEDELEALQAQGDSVHEALPEEVPPAYRQLPAVDRPARPVDVQSPLDARVWGSYARSRERTLLRSTLRKKATRTGQVLGLEVVRKLVGQVAQDPRLLTPLREAIVALEPSLLRLAMVDPRFFSDEQHPGRQLMERVARRGFHYNDEFGSDFLEFFDQVSQSFNALNARQIDGSGPFQEALAELEAAWAEQGRAAEAQREQAVQGLRFASERQSLADQIAQDLSARPDLAGVPSVILDFLYGPWCQVMAHARLLEKGRRLDPQGFEALVSDLVWSVQPDLTLRAPARLMKLIPRLVPKLREGLDLIGQDAEAQAQILGVLLRLHGPVLKLRRFKSEQDARESGAMALDSDLLPAPPGQRRPEAASRPWMAPRELSEIGFEDALVSAPAALETPATAPATADRADPQDVAAAQVMLLNLQTGDWVDLCSKECWYRAQLVWASANGTLFMFISHGGRPHSMTRRSCERLINNRLLRPVASHGVVSQALDALVGEQGTAAS
jgi:hypothetical protein